MVRFVLGLSILAGLSAASIAGAQTPETLEIPPSALGESALAVSPKSQVGDAATFGEGSIILQQMAQDYAFSAAVEKKLAVFDFEVLQHQLDSLIRMRVAWTPGTGNREILDAEIISGGRTVKTALKNYLETRNPDGDLINVPMGKTVTSVFVFDEIQRTTTSEKYWIKRMISPIGEDLYWEVKGEIAKDDENQKMLFQLSQNDEGFRAKLAAFQKQSPSPVEQGLDWLNSNTTFESVDVFYNDKTKEYVFDLAYPLGRGNSDEAAIALAGKSRLYREETGYLPPPGFKRLKFYMLVKIDAKRQITWKGVDFPSSSWPKAIADSPKFRKELDAQEAFANAKIRAKQSADGARAAAQPQRRQVPHPMRGPNGETISPPIGSAGFGNGSASGSNVGSCGSQLCIGTTSPK